MSRRSIRDRLVDLETAREAKSGSSVWFPDEPQPEDWDTAAIQVRFPDCPCCPNMGFPHI